MKRILYDMGHLTVAKWLLQRALKFNIPFCPRSLLRRVSLYGGCQKHPTKKAKKRTNMFRMLWTRKKVKTSK